MPASVKKTISANLLMGYYEEHAGEYGSGYPDVKNPRALLDGIASVIRAIGDGELSQNTLLYIIENEEDERNPLGARYLLMINHDSGNGSVPENYAIRLFYTGTNEMESLSTVEEDNVVWSPDTLGNTKHEMRTKYYLGFVYVLCDKSPGFDEEPVPENELTVEDLIELGVEGELPPELIEITLDAESGEASVETVGAEGKREAGTAEAGQVEASSETEESQAEEPLSAFDKMADALFADGASEAPVDAEIGEAEGAEQQSEPEVPEQDDTRVITYSPEEYEEEYNDLATDYEELFDDSMFN